MRSVNPATRRSYHADSHPGGTVRCSSRMNASGIRGHPPTAFGAISAWCSLAMRSRNSVRLTCFIVAACCSSSDPGHIRIDFGPVLQVERDDFVDVGQGERRELADEHLGRVALVVIVDDVVKADAVAGEDDFAVGPLGQEVWEHHRSVSGAAAARIVPDGAGFTEALPAPDERRLSAFRAGR